MVARRNASNAEQQTAQRRKQRNRLDQREQDLVKVMQTPEGRRVLFDIIDRQCNLHGGSYVESSHRTAYNEGKRAVGNELRVAIMTATPLDYVHMLNEQLAPERDDTPSQPEAD